MISIRSPLPWTGPPFSQPFPERPSTPEALSHRQLADWLRHAPREAALTQSGQSIPSDQAARLRQLLGQHERLSQLILQELADQGESLQESYSAPQLMALGALAAHLRLGLQALAASRS